MVGRAVIPRSRKPSEPPCCVGAIPTPSATFQTLNQRQPHEIHHPLPKPIALSPELQTESRDAHPTITSFESGVPTREPVRREATINHRPLAQKQSIRLITGRRR